MLLGIDVGGTHTDAVLLDQGGVAASCKVRTDHDNLIESVHASLETVLEGREAGCVRRLNLSTTLTTNAIVTGRIDPQLVPAGERRLAVGLELEPHPTSGFDLEHAVAHRPLLAVAAHFESLVEPQP